MNAESLQIIISAETAKLRSELEKAQKEVEKFKKTGKEKFGEFNDEFQKVGDGAKKACGVMATALVGAATAVLALGASTQEYRTAQARLTASFQEAGGSAEQAKQTYNDLYRVLGDTDTAVEAAQQLGNITTEQDKLAEYTTICQGVYAKWGTAIDSAGLAEGINHTIALGEVQGTLADTLEFAGVSVDDFNEKLAACNTESEREKLVRETLSGMYGEAAANYEETAASVLAQNEANAKLEESLAKVGEAVAPINTALTNLGAEILAQLEPYITEFAENYLPQITEALSGVGDAIGKVITWIADNWDWISTLAVIIAGIAAALAVFSTVMGIVNAVMAASPVTWIVLAIVAAIAALVAIIVLVIKHWDEIKATTLKVWDAIKAAIQSAVEAVVNWFNNLKEKISTIITNIKEKVSNIFSKIKEVIVNYITMAKDIVLSIFDGIKNGIQNKIETAKTIITNIIAAIKGIFTGDFGAAKTAVLNIFDAIKDGIKNKITNARDTVKGIIDAIKGFFNFTWELPKLKMPHFTVSGKFSLNPLQVPSFNISWYKLGGVFDSPTLFSYGNGALGGLGEDGAEAIVPLERNLRWLDRLATMLNEKQGNTPIVLQVDGRTFAEISVNSINQLTKQRGSLALNLV
jgi:hypothetical protein